MTLYLLDLIGVAVFAALAGVNSRSINSPITGEMKSSGGTITYRW